MIEIYVEAYVSISVQFSWFHLIIIFTKIIDEMIVLNQKCGCHQKCTAKRESGGTQQCYINI